MPLCVFFRAGFPLGRLQDWGHHSPLGGTRLGALRGQEPGPAELLHQPHISVTNQRKGNRGMEFLD